MWNSHCWTAAGSAALLFWVTVFGSLDGLLATEATCRDTEYKVTSHWIEDTTRNCTEIRGAVMQAEYGTELTKACDNLVGVSVQNGHAVSSYYVNKCEYNDVTKTARYYAEVCCQKPDNSILLCYNCADDFDNEDACIRNGSITSMTCDPDNDGRPRMCRTDIDYLNKGTWGESLEIKRTSYCALEDECLQAQKEAIDSGSCNAQAEDPNCVLCCDGQLCNKDQDDELPFKYVGKETCDHPVKGQGPCQNGGSCRINKEAVQCDCSKTAFWGDRCELPSKCKSGEVTCANEGFCEDLEDYDHKCHCRVGYTGDDCTEEVEGRCDSATLCSSRGTCFLYDSGITRCKCFDGYLGDKCEIEKLQCVNERVTRPGMKQQFRTGKSRGCTGETSKRHNDKSVNKYCSTHMMYEFNMKQKYRPDIDAPDYSKSKTAGNFTLAHCSAGEDYTFLENEFCCPVCMSAPCLNGGYCKADKAMPDGYFCECRHGFAGTNCELVSGTCIVSGDPHQKTYDGLMWTWQRPGAGNYRLVETEEVNVTLTTELDGDISYATGVKVEACGKVVVLAKQSGHRVSTVDGVFHSCHNPEARDCVKLSKSGTFCKITLVGKGITVGFDFDSTAYVEASGELEGQLAGMCGNFDGDPSNDDVNRDGIPASSDEEQVHQWLEPGTVNAETTDNPVPKCEEDLNNFKEYCTYLADDGNDFAENCHDSDIGQDVRAFDHANCLFDACVGRPGKTTQQTACTMIETAVLTCEGQGKSLGDWRTEADCHLECPLEGEKAYYNTADCQKSCQNPFPECGQKTNFCGCEDGLVRDDNDACVEPTACQCDTEIKKLNIGESVIGPSCSTKTTCEYCEDCPEGYAKSTITEIEACTEDENCVVNDDGSGRCVQKSPCSVEGQEHVHGATWKDTQLCVTPMLCDDGTTKASKEDCQPYVVPVFNEIKTSFADVQIQGADVRVNADDLGQEQPFHVTTSLESTIVLTKIVGGVPNSITCENTKECTLDVTFNPEDAAFRDTVLTITVIEGNRRTGIIYPVEIPALTVQCVPSGEDAVSESDSDGFIQNTQNIGIV